jgi:hypothetical protein
LEEGLFAPNCFDSFMGLLISRTNIVPQFVFWTFLDIFCTLPLLRTLLNG